MAGQAKAPFYIVMFVIVVGLLALGIYNLEILAPKGDTQSPSGDGEPITLQIEDPAGEGITTVKEYSFTPAQRLPEVKGTSGYKPLEDNTVRFALNVWAGWAPIIYANQGFQANKVWTMPDGTEFKVELVLVDNPVAMRDAYAQGEVHIGWATLDMVPLFMEGLVDKSGKARDSRVMPRIYQQVDWSNGGDGIVIRSNVKSISDLRGKKLVLAQNSPSEYFALNMLVAGGVQPSEVKMVYTEDAFQAAAAFNAQRDIAGVVSWAPDIYNLEKVQGNRLLVTTGTANKLIADVWFARADFAKDHPGIIEGLVRGIFDAMIELKDENARMKVAEFMAEGYNIPASETLAMLGDAHSTNWAENYQFFMNQNNPANFERVWRNAYYLYKRIGSITHTQVPFDQVMDFSVIDKLSKEEKYASQRDEYTVKFTPASGRDISVEKEILTNTAYIHFFPNSHELNKKITKKKDGKDVEEFYDPNVDFVLEDIAKLAGQFGAARIVIEGHTDSSMKGQVPEDLVKELSEDRANAVKESLVNKYSLDPNQLSVRGMGWARPVDLQNPMNHAKNRRVEIKIYPAEQE